MAKFITVDVLMRHCKACDRRWPARKLILKFPRRCPKCQKDTVEQTVERTRIEAQEKSTAG